MSRMTGKVPKSMRSLGVKGGESRRQLADRKPTGKMAVKMECVYCAVCLMWDSGLKE